MKSKFSGKKIAFVFSLQKAVNDEFARGLEILNMEELLFRHLKKEGFKRVLFYNGVDGLFAYDEESFRSRKKRKSLSVIKKREDKDKVLRRNLPESELPKTLETVLHNEKVKSAFIITDMFSLLENSDSVVLKELNQIIVDVKQHSVHNENILIFLDHSEATLEVIKNKLTHIRGISNLTHALFKDLNVKNLELTENVVFIDLPEKDEIRNLLNYLRLKYDKKTDFLEFERIVDEIYKYSKQNAVNLKGIMKRIIKSDITFEGVIKALGIKKELSGWERLNALKGIDNVKKEIKSIVKKLKRHKPKEYHTDEIKRIVDIDTKNADLHFLNILLTGNPGVGKTTIAKIIGEIFKEEGVLEGGQFIKVSKSDLVGEHVGESAIKTRNKIKQALGGVLFIDEAYALAQDEHFGRESINELVDAMSEYKGRLSVIAAGYEDDIKEFLKTNDGLKSRFNYKIHLYDYTPDVLEGIFDSIIEKKSLKISDEVKKIKREFFENFYKNRDKTSGNARFVESLADELEKSLLMYERDVITIDDFDKFKSFLPAKYVKFNTNPQSLKELNSLIGLKNVKKMIEMLIINIVQEQKKNKKVGLPHLMFAGNPGTGKTTVARIVYDIFKELGLAEGKFIEVGGRDLTGRYVGETEKKVTEIFKEAIGGVLFIDEAHTLAEGGENDYGKVALRTLIKLMEDYRGKISVIFAGYEDDLEKLKELDQGFESRIGMNVKFEDYDADELMEIFEYFAKNEELKLTDDARKKLKELISKMVENKGRYFGNARDVRKFFNHVKSNLNYRTYKNGIDGEGLYIITQEDIKE